MIDVQGADHYGQFPFVRAAAAALGCDPERIELVLHQMVSLTMGGQQVRQSQARAATFVTVDEVLRQIGADVFRFFMIQRRPDSHLDFDLDLARETDWTKNPAYYVQYAHARSCGVAREAEQRGVAHARRPRRVDAARLALPEEIELLRKLGEFPEVVRARRGDARAAPRRLLPARARGALEPVPPGREAPPHPVGRRRAHRGAARALRARCARCSRTASRSSA